MLLVRDTMWEIAPNKGRAIMLAKRQLPEFVYDAVNLEGINFTLPEIQTLLDGVTIGGHKVSEQQIALNQAEAWRVLFNWIEQDQFVVSAGKACELHAIAAKDEALEWGKFRSGSVTIAGTNYMPPDSDRLVGVFDLIIEEMHQLDDIYDQAIHVFLSMARNQFFYDVNKRMGRFMMNGLLLSSGYPAINLPVKRQLEFNHLMMEFYESAYQQPMNDFFRSCLDERIIKIMREK